MKLSDWRLYLACLLIGAAFGILLDANILNTNTTDVSKTITDTVTTKKQIKTKHTKRPDGTETTETTVTDETKDSTKTKNRTTVTTTPAKTNVSALIGISTSKIDAPIYGASISHEVVGPLSIGIVFLTNGFVGGTLGYSF